MGENKTMKRRKFLKLSAAGAAMAGTAAVLLNSDRLFKAARALENNANTIPQDAKKVFSQCGACSNTFFTLLNREFGCPMNTEERAADPLAGGLMNTQNQCGMLWGSSLALGAESFRRFKNRNQALAMAVIGTQHLVESFRKRTRSLNCKEVIGVDISHTFDIAKFMLKSLPGGYSNMVCMNLAEHWAPEAIQSAKVGLSDRQTLIPQLPRSCAAEVLKKMGAGDEERITVAGLAGGMGLSGHACGALGAAIWMNTLTWCRNNPGKSGYGNPDNRKTLDEFYKATGSEILCHKISGQKFASLSDHKEFMESGGCEELINILARS